MLRRSLRIFAFIAFGTLVLSCKTRTPSSELHEIWINLLDNKLKAVQEVADKNEFITTFSQLPLSGRAQPLPWTDAIYPDTLGGISFRSLTNLSPIEKFDLLQQHPKWELTIAERQRTATPPKTKKDERKSLNPDWAAAAILYAEPIAVRLKSPNGQEVAFTSSDVKALLSHYLHQHSTLDDGVETRSLGGVCHMDSETFRKGLESRTLTEAEWKEFDGEECYRVNAAAFHLSLGNLLGLRHDAFIMDPVRDRELSYLPVSGFASEILASSKSETGHTILQVKTKVEAIAPLAKAAEKSSSAAPITFEYRYSLEIDEAGDVIDGMWQGESHPQLAWMQTRPRFDTGDTALEKLYTASVSLPQRMAMHDFSSLHTEELRTTVRTGEPLVVNKKYRLELKGDVPRGADGLKTFLIAAFRPVGTVTIYRNTFADEDNFVSIEVQCNTLTSFEALGQAIKNHSNGRAEIQKILRP